MPDMIQKEFHLDRSDKMSLDNLSNSQYIEVEFLDNLSI